ncbi:MAG TPA: hypothetical protein VGM15_12260 [Burkholderiaceae bacterium]
MIPGSTVARLALSAVVLRCLSRASIGEPFPGACEADVEVGNGVRIRITAQSNTPEQRAHRFHDLLADFVKRCG